MTTTFSSTPPMTAKRRGRPLGPTTDLGREFLDWPVGKWITRTFEDGPTALAAAKSLRNLAWRKGVAVSVLTDREDETALHILKYEKENEDVTQE